MKPLPPILLLTLSALALPPIPPIPHPRKLVFSPYLSVTEDLSAPSPGQEADHPPQTQYNPILGPFQGSPVPAFGLGGMTPPSLGLTSMPYNYMLNSPMMHPLNPMHPNGPLNYSGANTEGGYSGDPAQGGSAGGLDRRLGGWGPYASSGIIVALHCKDRRRQTIEIAKAIMKKQNKIIYYELMQYLLNVKQAVKASEIKETQAFRTKMAGLMSHFGNLSVGSINFVHSVDFTEENDVKDYSDENKDGLDLDLVSQSFGSLDSGDDDSGVEITYNEKSMTNQL